MTQTTISNKQLTVFMATTQLLANYSCLKKEPRNAVGTYSDTDARAQVWLGYWCYVSQVCKLECCYPSLATTLVIPQVQTNSGFCFQYT